MSRPTPIPSGLTVFRALTHPDWRDDSGNPTMQAFFPSERDGNDGLSLCGSDRIGAPQVEAWLRSRRYTGPVYGVAGGPVDDIRKRTSRVRGVALDVLRTPRERSNPKNPHCSLYGFNTIDPVKPTQDEQMDALDLVEIFENALAP